MTIGGSVAAAAGAISLLRGKRVLGLLFLDVVLEVLLCLAGLAPVLDDNAGAPDDLPGLSLLVDFAEAGPLAKLLAVVDGDQGDLVLHAKGLKYKLGPGISFFGDTIWQHSKLNRKQEL